MLRLVSLCLAIPRRVVSKFGIAPVLAELQPMVELQVLVLVEDLRLELPIQREAKLVRVILKCLQVMKVQQLELDLAIQLVPNGERQHQARGMQVQLQPVPLLLVHHRRCCRNVTDEQTGECNLPQGRCQSCCASLLEELYRQSPSGKVEGVPSNPNQG